MPKPTIREIAQEINRLAPDYEMGGFPQLRARLKHRNRLPNVIFTSKTIFDRYAFHHGGRTELQYNIGFEDEGESQIFRFGVAFSLELGRNLTNIDPLVPKIRRFNEFFLVNDTEYSDFRMWHHDGNGKSSVSSPSAIPEELIHPGVFLFLGKTQAPDQVDYNEILEDFDRLLPLYQFIEREDHDAFPSLQEKFSFDFREGHFKKRARTTLYLPERTVDITVIHDTIQNVLYELLRKDGHAVGTERPSGNGGRVDLMVKHSDDEYWFYEIKVGSSAKSCIRQALAQLLEYAYWPGGIAAAKLVIVGEPTADADARQYLESLRSRFNLPICYQSIDLRQGRLAPQVPRTD